ncbi:MAG: TonB C-terminal domain-containing protein [Gammaproteobacteria bacterium]|nr:TonB C-terminal domain-containing protein [Gammaproteobacteria bacterium]
MTGRLQQTYGITAFCLIFVIACNSNPNQAQHELYYQTRINENRAIKTSCEAKSEAPRITACFVTAIKNRIEDKWIKPLNAFNQVLIAQVKIQLDQSGNIKQIEFLSASENQLFDHSIEVALRNATPLPIPDDESLKQEFYEIILPFRHMPGS